MRNGNSDEIATLIEPGRVHRRVYTDPDIFDLEMERIFGRAWLYVGHISQVPSAGDYITNSLRTSEVAALCLPLRTLRMGHPGEQGSGVPPCPGLPVDRPAMSRALP